VLELPRHPSSTLPGPGKVDAVDGELSRRALVVGRDLDTLCHGRAAYRGTLIGPRRGSILNVRLAVCEPSRYSGHMMARTPS